MGDSMTILESIRNYFCACPLLKDGALNVDYLDADFNYNIESVPTNPILKRYVDGGSQRQFTFLFCSREEWGNDTLNNLENNGFYESLQDWLETTISLPIMDSKYQPLKIECLTYGYLMGNTADKAIYQIQLRLIYNQDK